MLISQNSAENKKKMIFIRSRSELVMRIGQNIKQN